MHLQSHKYFLFVNTSLCTSHLEQSHMFLILVDEGDERVYLILTSSHFIPPLFLISTSRMTLNDQAVAVNLLAEVKK